MERIIKKSDQKGKKKWLKLLERMAKIKKNMSKTTIKSTVKMTRKSFENY